jgi:hypothetical protein
MTAKTIPTSVQHQARRAIAAIVAWNSAIYRARYKELQHQKPGYYEHAIRVDRKHIPMRLGASQGAHALDGLEATVRALGWMPQALYLALGTSRPQLEPPGPHVEDWFEAQR